MKNAFNSISSWLAHFRNFGVLSLASPLPMYLLIEPISRLLSR